MNKRLNAPHSRNARLGMPLGLLGIPPDEDPPRLPSARGQLRIIVIEADEYTANRIMSAIDDTMGRRNFIWPQ